MSLRFQFFSLLILVLFFTLGCSNAQKKEINGESVVAGIQYRNEKMQVEEIISNTRLRIRTEFKKPFLNEKLALLSKDKEIGIYGIGQVKKISPVGEFQYDVELEILSLAPRCTVQLHDPVTRLDLRSENESYLGRTTHLVSESDRSVSSRYKPLFTQGFSIGETAETLWKDEFLFTYYGLVYYGAYDFLSLGTLLPLNAVGSGNGAVKLRFYKSEANVFATGLTYTKIPNTQDSTLNLNFMWDSISNGTTITHSFITLAVLSFNKAEDASAIKSLGTSSLQTGYEFIMDNWSRILVGPNFNFEKKSVGGYFSYLKIWEKTHLQFSINSTNIRSFKLSPTDGYYAFFDAYWRY